MSKRERAARVGVALAGLAASKHYKLDDLTIQVYDRALADLRVDDIEAVCRELEKTGEWMPKPAAIRQAVVDRAVAERRAQLQHTVATTRGAYCAECRDTGWKYSSQNAVIACPCRPENPAFQLRRIQ